MKKIGLVNLVVLALLFLVTSCVVETKECEDDHIGTVKVTNTTGEYWNFDVTYDQNNDGTWVTNEEQRLSDNESYKWEDVGSGVVTIWANDINTDWVIVDTVNLGDCEDYTITYSSKCDLFNTGEVTVVNNSGQYLVVNVYSETSETWSGDKYLQDGYEIEYSEVKSGTISFRYRIYAHSDYYYSSNYTLETCGNFQFTWNSKKMATNNKAPKANNAVKAIKVAK